MTPKPRHMMPREIYRGGSGSESFSTWMIVGGAFRRSTSTHHHDDFVIWIYFGEDDSSEGRSDGTTQRVGQASDTSQERIASQCLEVERDVEGAGEERHGVEDGDT